MPRLWSGFEASLLRFTRGVIFVHRRPARFVPVRGRCRWFLLYVVLTCLLCVSLLTFSFLFMDRVVDPLLLLLVLIWNANGTLRAVKRYVWWTWYVVSSGVGV